MAFQDDLDFALRVAKGKRSKLSPVQIEGKLKELYSLEKQYDELPPTNWQNIMKDAILERSVVYNKANTLRRELFDLH